MELYHGSHKHTELTLHIGICLCESESFAEQYAAGKEVFVVDLDGSDLNLVEVEGYDHDTNSCPADHPEYRARMAADGADVLVYEDEDEMGREHTCYRLVSDKALAAVREMEE